MCTTEDDENSRRTLAQLWHTINNRQDSDRPLSFYSNKCIVEAILKEEDFNVNYKIAESRVFERFGKRLKVCTALHILASATFDIDIFNNLLERGADFTVKNENGQTALHLLIATHNHYGKINAPFIDSLLSAHVKFKNSSNPRDEHDVSHFHGACIANHVEAVAWFLKKRASVKETVSFEAPRYAGYSPLHFAADFGSYDVAQMLVRRGAKVSSKDAKGMTPMDLLMVRRLEMLADVNDLNDRDDDGRKSRVGELRNAERIACRENDRLEDLCSNEKIAQLLLPKSRCRSGINLSNFQVACTLKDLGVAENLLKQGLDVDYALPNDNSFRPGYTAAHFAAINGVDAIKLLLAHGARIDIEDARGTTAIDICSRNYTKQDFHDILMCCEYARELRLSDGETRLMDFVQATIDSTRWKQFSWNNIEDVIVPRESSLWPGCGILHLAIILSTRIKRNYRLSSSERRYYDASVVGELSRNVNVSLQDAKGQTPMHLAFRLGKENIVKLLIGRLDAIDRVSNFVDEDNLSYLHIASALKDRYFTAKLLKNSQANVVYKGKRIPQEHLENGSTPLHMVAASKAHIIANMLMSHGANLHETDAEGLTPIHWLLKRCDDDFYDRLVSEMFFHSLLEKPENRVVEGVGLSYLHVACDKGHAKTVKKLLDLGSNVDAIVNSKKTSFLADYSTFGPLDFARRYANPQVLDLLMRHRGTEAFVEPSNFLKNCVLLDKYDVSRSRFLEYHGNEVQRYLEERLGMPKLHIACYMKNQQLIRNSLDNGAEVNARLHDNFEIFAGCTSLHLLVTVPESNKLEYVVCDMMRLLVDAGADVTIANAEGDTPVHVYYKFQRHFTAGDTCSDLLLSAHRDFKVNPANVEGTSHFHLACLWDKVEIVENFLRHNAALGINRPIDFFAEKKSGCTPLHLALIYSKKDRFLRLPHDYWTKLSRMVWALLRYGADATAKDTRGDTPLHKCQRHVGPSSMEIMKNLVRYGAKVNINNLKGEYTMGKWEFEHGYSYRKLFQKNMGYQVNSWNLQTGEGQIAKIVRSVEFQKFMRSLEMSHLDEMNRTVIHNSMAMLDEDIDKVDNYTYIIENTMKQGIEINHQDKAGKTALHYAARMHNGPGVVALLEYGSDINIVDKFGKPPYFYALENVKHDYSFVRKIFDSFNEHIRKLQYLGLDVSVLNQDIASCTQNILNISVGNLKEFQFKHQVEITKTLDLKIKSLTLYHFLSETWGISLYVFLSKSEQKLIDDFFKSIDFEELKQLAGIIKLQIKKIKIRSQLIEPALSSLRLLLGFSVPGLCEEITMFLTTYDLKNLIASTSIGDAEDMGISKKEYKKKRSSIRKMYENFCHTCARFQR